MFPGQARAEHGHVLGRQGHERHGDQGSKYQMNRTRRHGQQAAPRTQAPEERMAHFVVSPRYSDDLSVKCKLGSEKSYRVSSYIAVRMGPYHYKPVMIGD